MAASVTNVYLHVMDDVINNVRADFQAENVDENVLNELQSLWELKMIQSGAIVPSEMPLHTGSRSAAQPAPVQDLNIPYQGTEEFTPTTELLFSPYSTPTPGPDQTTADSADGKAGKPADPQQQNAAWLNQKRRGVDVDVNVAYEEGQEEEENGPAHAPVTKDFFTLTSGKRKRDELPSNIYSGNFIPQQDGVNDVSLGLLSSKEGKQKSTNSSSIPQHDGADDNYDDEVAQEDYNETGDDELQPANEAQKAAQAEGAESEGSEPPLNEEDDDEDDLNDIDQGDDEPKTSHLVLAQFEKVTRSKNKWKCILKDGIMHLNNRDILFVKANGEFEF